MKKEAENRADLEISEAKRKLEVRSQEIIDSYRTEMEKEKDRLIHETQYKITTAQMEMDKY